MGYPDGIYRVGPLARLNLVTNCGTPRADHELGILRSFAGSPLVSSFHYHHARLIEMLYCLERMERIVDESGYPESACARFCPTEQRRRA